MTELNARTKKKHKNKSLPAKRLLKAEINVNESISSGEDDNRRAL